VKRITACSRSVRATRTGPISTPACKLIPKHAALNARKTARRGKVFVRNAGKRSGTHYFALEALRPLEARRKGDVDVDEGT